MINIHLYVHNPQFNYHNQFYDGFSQVTIFTTPVMIGSITCNMKTFIKQLPFPGNFCCSIIYIWAAPLHSKLAPAYKHTVWLQLGKVNFGGGK